MAGEGEGQPDFVFVVDECITSHDIVASLRGHGAVVHTAVELDLLGCDDGQVIEVVAGKGWVLLSKDKRMKNRMQWRSELEQHKAAAFYLLRGNLGGPAMAAAFTSALPSMLQKLKKYTRPLICTVSAAGDVTVLVGERRGSVKR